MNKKPQSLSQRNGLLENMFRIVVVIVVLISLFNIQWISAAFYLPFFLIPYIIYRFFSYSIFNNSNLVLSDVRLYRFLGIIIAFIFLTTPYASFATREMKDAGLAVVLMFPFFGSIIAYVGIEMADLVYLFVRNMELRAPEGENDLRIGTYIVAFITIFIFISFFMLVILNR